MITREEYENMSYEEFLFWESHRFNCTPEELEIKIHKAKVVRYAKVFLGIVIIIAGICGGGTYSPEWMSKVACWICIPGMLIELYLFYLGDKIRESKETIW